MSEKTIVDRIEEILKTTGEVEVGSVIHIIMEHEQGCPAGKTHRLVDCTCSPRLVVERLK
jgi:hypothetical protein